MSRRRLKDFAVDKSSDEEALDLAREPTSTRHSERPIKTRLCKKQKRLR
jgi:hypothetical protein